MTDRMTRRGALGMLGAAGIGAVLSACSDGDDGRSSAAETTTTSAPPATGAFDDAAVCTVSPELTEGPFYFDVERVRSDIREDRDGVPLRLGVRVRDAAACAPIADAVVDVWHCDAQGEYSAQPQTFLRGAQVTGANGVAEFQTIYPGWYPGRTIHVHAKVHLDNATVLTTQLFFDDVVSDTVLARTPYSDATGRDRNDGDAIFDAALVMTLGPEGDGYVGRITLDVAQA